MGWELNARLLQLDEGELKLLRQAAPKGANGKRFALLRKLAVNNSVTEDQINQWFEDDPERTSDEAHRHFFNAGVRYELGKLTPKLLGLQPNDPGYIEWDNGVRKFKREARDLYDELTSVVAFLLRLTQDANNNRKGSKIRFSLSYKPQYKTVYRIGIHNGKVKARLRIEGPCFMRERDDEP